MERANMRFCTSNLVLLSSRVGVRQASHFFLSEASGRKNESNRLLDWSKRKEFHKLAVNFLFTTGSENSAILFFLQEICG